MPLRLALVLLSGSAALAAAWTPAADRAQRPDAAQAGAQPAPDAARDRGVATFAGGCFWCVEEAFDKVDGVVDTTSGYIGGTRPNPTYEEVVTGGTGHTEAVRVVYDPARVSYERLLYVFWRNIDPTVADRQFCDRGSQYRAGIFYHDDTQKQLAEASRAALLASGRFERIVTEITPASTFYRAEAYHQDYYRRNPTRYRLYKWNCGRERRLQQLWGDEAGGGT